MRRLLGMIVALTWLGAAPVTALAQDGGEGESEEEEAEESPMRTEGLDDEEARSRFRIGQALHAEGRFLEAAQEFERSYELSQRRSLLYNAYVSYRDAGRLEDAVRTLDLYLQGDDDPEDAAELRQRLASLERRVEEERAREAEAQAEREQLAAERAAAEQRAEEERQRAEEERRRAELASQGPNPIGWVVGGVGAAMIAGGVVAGVLAQNQRGDLEDNCPDDRCVVGFDLEGERSEVERPRIAADVLLFAGGATLITGVVLLFVGRGGDPSDDEQAPTADLSCDATGCLGRLRGTF